MSVGAFGRLFYYHINILNVVYKIWETSMALGVSSKAQQAELKAFKDLGEKMKMAKPLVSPAGFDAGFPDFAYRLELSTGKTVDLHFEYKADYKAQMGSMRDWIFNGTKFTTLDTESESKSELLAIMNNTPVAVTNGKRLLADLQKYFHPSVQHLFSGSLTAIKDKETRRAMTREFMNGTANYQIANISDNTMGDKIIAHYKNKFKKNLKPGNDVSILFMMLKDTVWMVDQIGNLTPAEKKEVTFAMGLRELDPLRGLAAKLEVRIQPRGMSGSTKMPSIDVMASFRLSSAPTGGGKVI